MAAVVAEEGAALHLLGAAGHPDADLGAHQEPVLHLQLAHAARERAGHPLRRTARFEDGQQSVLWHG